MTVPFAAVADDLALRGTTWLATQPGDYDPSTGKGPDWGKAAPIGLLIILLLAVALFFLIRSMNKNLRRVPASFDPPSEQPGADPSGDGAADRPAGHHVAAEAARTDSTPGSVSPSATGQDESPPPR